MPRNPLVVRSPISVEGVLDSPADPTVRAPWDRPLAIFGGVPAGMLDCIVDRAADGLEAALDGETVSR